MTHNAKLATLTALMLSCALLGACGGGDAEAPPPAAANVVAPPPPAGPDTTPPTVTIASDVSAATATGPVTFTFVFSEDVGTSFDASDVVVTGGTPGAFLRIGGTQATLVVTPTPNATGTMTVSVAAGRFADIATNANTAAATASKNYAAAPPPPPPTPTGTVLANFDTVSPPIAGFEGGEGSVVEAGPAGGSGNALKVLRSGGQVFALAVVNLPTTIPLEAGRLTISARVFSPTANIPMVLKLEGPGGNPSTGDMPANQTVVVGWQTLTWTAPAVNTNYNTLVLLPNLGTVDAPPGKAYFFDDIALLGTASGGGGGGGAGSALITFDETTAPKLTDFGVNGAPPVIATDPTGGTNKVLKAFKYALPAPGSEQWAGVTVSTGANDSIAAIPFTTTAKTITARVYSPVIGVRVRMKVENATNPGISVETDAITTTANAWETLTFNFANPGLSPPVGGGPTAPLDLAQTYNKLSIFSDFGIGNGGSGPLPADRTYYYDDITFVGAAGGGGGGGGGAATPVTFSTGFAAGGLTDQGGAYFSYSGSNQDGFNCSGGPAFCGSGTGGSGATSFFFAYYQTPTPATALYNGISVLAPGVTAVSGTADTAGVQVTNQTTVNFTFNNNAEWQNSGTNNFAVLLTLGKFYDLDAGPAVQACNIKLLAVVTPINGGAASPYAIPLSSFAVIQNCNTTINTVAAALASSAVSEVAFQAAGGGSALPTVGGKTTGANLSVASGGVYPTTLAITGGVSFQP